MAICTIVVVGLPSCGKTHWAQYYGRNRYQVLDEPETREEIETLLKTDNNVCIVDRFCITPDAQEDLKRLIAETRPRSVVDWFFYMNDPVRCKRNLARKTGPKVPPEVIDALSAQYTIPSWYMDTMPCYAL